MTAPVTAAGTITHTDRGAVSLDARSESDEAPTAPSDSLASTASVDWSNTTQRCPAASILETMFEPIRPRPIMPSSTALLSSMCRRAAVVDWSARPGAQRLGGTHQGDV